MKRSGWLASLAVLLALTMSACTGSKSADTTTAAPTTEAAETTAAGMTEESTAGIAETQEEITEAETTEEETSEEETTEAEPEMVYCRMPALLTSIGRSGDVEIVKSLCKKAGLRVSTNPAVTAEKLPADCKTLILAVGGLSHGLKAVGTDAEQELARAEALLAKAKEQGTVILAMFTGGSARRGSLTDFLIVPCFTAADEAVVVSEGDQDGLIRGILEENRIFGIYVEKAADAAAVLAEIFTDMPEETTEAAETPEEDSEPAAEIASEAEGSEAAVETASETEDSETAAETEKPA